MTTRRSRQAANLDSLIAYHESWAATLRATRELQDRHLLPGSWAAISTNGNAPTQKAKRKTATSSRPTAKKTVSLKEQRAASAKMLEGISRTVPVPATTIGRGLGAYVRRGYLAKKGIGYVRTAKEYQL